MRRIVANEERVTHQDRELHLECERRPDSKEEEGGSSRSKIQRTVSGAKQASRLRPQSEVKQVRFAIGPWEEGAAELRDGGVGRGQATEEDAQSEGAEERQSHALRHLPYCTWYYPHEGQRGMRSSGDRFGLLLPWLRGPSWNHETCRTKAGDADDLCPRGARVGHQDSTSREKGCWLFFASSGPFSVKSDGAPAMKASVDEIAMGRPEVQTIKEESPLASSGSDSAVWKAIPSVQCMLRVMQCALEARGRRWIPHEHRAFARVADLAAVLMNRCEAGKNGRAAYELSMGKKGKLSRIEFGERVLFWRHPIGGQLAKLSSLWKYGTFFGVRSAQFPFLFLLCDHPRSWEIGTFVPALSAFF